jgi:hypothetical protein
MCAGARVIPEGLRGILAWAQAACVKKTRDVLEPHVDDLIAHGQCTIDPLLQIEDRGEVVVAARSLDVLGTDLGTERE